MPDRTRRRNSPSRLSMLIIAHDRDALSCRGPSLTPLDHARCGPSMNPLGLVDCKGFGLDVPDSILMVISTGILTLHAMLRVFASVFPGSIAQTSSHPTNRHRHLGDHRELTNTGT